MSKFSNLLPIIFSILITFGGASGTWALYGWRIAQAEDDIEEVTQKYVTKEILILTLKPIKQDAEYTKNNIKEILEYIKKK